jgi:uncharacterized protein (TIGR02271 family)
MSTDFQGTKRLEQHPTEPSHGRDAAVRTAELDAASSPSPAHTSAHGILSAQALAPGQSVNVPVIQEHLSVEKRIVETGEVVVHVEPRVERQLLEVPLLEDAVEVERVPVNRFVEAPTPVRQEGNITVVPVFEEVLIVQKRLMLKEEIRLVRRRVATVERQTFEVRKEEAHVLRAAGTADAAADLHNPAAHEGTPVAKPVASAEGRRA